jgi:hypothetical protein
MNIVGKEKFMFLEIEQLRKSYGTGENKVEVLKGIQLGGERENLRTAGTFRFGKIYTA